MQASPSFCSICFCRGVGPEGWPYHAPCTSPALTWPGLISVLQIVGSIIPVLIAPVVKGAFGWHGLFFVGFGGLFAGELLRRVNKSISWRFKFF